MGKSRGGAAKAGSVFRIARSGVLRAKAKGKARPVTSGLKQINIKNAEKVSAINKAFAEVQREIQQLSKGTTAEPQKTQQVSTNPEKEPAMWMLPQTYYLSCNAKWTKKGLQEMKDHK